MGAPDDYADDDSESFGRRPARAAPLIAKSEPDFIMRWIVGLFGTATVLLLSFICNAQYNGNRELGEIRAEFNATVIAMDRRLTMLEQRAWKNDE